MKFTASNGRVNIREITRAHTSFGYSNNPTPMSIVAGMDAT